jgi:hypothetical protein
LLEEEEGVEEEPEAEVVSSEETSMNQEVV